LQKTCHLCSKAKTKPTLTKRTYKNYHLQIEPMIGCIFSNKPRCRWVSRPYWLSLTFKFIQDRWFSSYMKGHTSMRFPVSDQ